MLPWFRRLRTHTFSLYVAGHNTRRLPTLQEVKVPEVQARAEVLWLFKKKKKKTIKEIANKALENHKKSKLNLNMTLVFWP